MDHAHHALTHQWNTTYIALSYVIATFASYVSLELAARAGRRPTEAGNRFWLVAQALIIGYGIWAMHFVGMLAFQVPAAISYNLPLTVLSGVAAVALLYPALLILHGGALTAGRLLTAGGVAGTGIVVMHYLGMYALRIPGTAVSVSWAPFLASVLIAVGASVAAFFLFKLVSSEWAEGRSRAVMTALKLGAGLVMGFAIVSMHYTGMAALRHRVVDAGALGTTISGADTGLLALLIGVVTFLLIGLAVTSILMDSGSTHDVGELEFTAEGTD
ncbi:MHYT domain-containing protein [Deinococcus planocerae]|uniref:MHYT domain-containing protein n=1 Tax=Deinococcus planocerae TaxID=1737569 RepID=UPI000C7F2C36|nr:MHYT domain-containing protein [Deinococcus planocerae]